MIRPFATVIYRALNSIIHLSDILYISREIFYYHVHDFVYFMDGTQFEIKQSFPKASSFILLFDWKQVHCIWLYFNSDLIDHDWRVYSSPDVYKAALGCHRTIHQHYFPPEMKDAS